MKKVIMAACCALLVQACDLARDRKYSDDSFDYLFQTDKIHHFRLVISRSEWDALTNDMWQSSRDWGSLGRGNDYGTNNFYFNASFYRKARFINTDTGEVFDNAGIKVRGSTSRFVPQYWDGSFKWAHFRISFSHEYDGNEDVYGSPAIPTLIKNKRKMYGVRGLTLKYTRSDSTWVKEPWSYEFIRRFGIPAPRTAYAHLDIEITGYTNLNYGLFQIIEPIDKAFVERVFGQGGHLYKCLITADGPASFRTQKFFAWDNDYDRNVSIGIEKMDPANHTEALSWDRSDWPCDPTQARVYRPRYDIAWTENPAEARDRLDNFIMELNSRTGSSFEQWIDSALDVDGILRVLAVDVLLGQWDSYFMNFNNFYLYYHPGEQRFVYIPYDYDGCMYHSGIMDVESWGMDILNRSVTNWPSTNAVLINKILAIPRYRELYYSYVRELITRPGFYNWPDMQARMEQLQSVIRDYATDPGIVHDDPAGFIDVDDSAFENFVQSRLNVVHQELYP